jgi:alpha-galactosidase
MDTSKKKKRVEKYAGEVGHAAHTKSASATSLEGEFLRPIKVTFLGAGSHFAPRLANDLFLMPGNKGGTLALVDIDAKRLELSRQMLAKLIEKMGVDNWEVVVSTERREVLADSHYIVNCIEVSGLDCVVYDNDIPLKYGIDQCIGDTIGPGGLFKSLRTIPVWLEVLKDCEDLCPEALVLNYTNPMSMMCLAAARSSSMNVIGLCHSVQGTSQLLSEYAEVPYPELSWECAGINHLSWFTKLEHKGKNLYPSLYERFSKDLADAIIEYDALEDKADLDELKGKDLIRKDMAVHFGAFITESSGHLSEYLPYYRKSEEGRKLHRMRYDGESRFYASSWPSWRTSYDVDRADMLEGRKPLGWDRSWEYATWIIEAKEKNAPYRFHGNVINNVGGAGSLITNLPADGCVEVACLVDGNGVHPTRYGALPAHMAGVCVSNMSMFDLGAQAAMEKSIEKAIYALMLDPLTAAVCTPAQIKAMTLEMFEAEKSFLSPDYK